MWAVDYNKMQFIALFCECWTTVWLKNETKELEFDYFWEEVILT